jgi:hypothetical protein
MKTIIIIFLTYLCVLPDMVLSQSQTYDLFPLEVGMNRVYLFKSSEEGITLPAPTIKNTDIGTVTFKVTQKSDSDSTIIWTIMEIDSLNVTRICRNCYSSEYHKEYSIDTSYKYYAIKYFTLEESKSTNHKIMSYSYYPIWHLPILYINNQYYYGDIKLPLTRFSNISNQIYEDSLWGSPFSYHYSFFFKENIGLFKAYLNATRSSNTHYNYTWSATLIDPIVNIKGNNSYLPDKYQLHQNYPNPFNLETTIRYSLPKEEFINITIYNILGQKVKTLINGRQNAGEHFINWDGGNDLGRIVCSGTYIYQLNTERNILVKKLNLLK